MKNENHRLHHVISSLSYRPIKSDFPCYSNKRLLSTSTLYKSLMYRQSAPSILLLYPLIRPSTFNLPRLTYRCLSTTVKSTILTPVTTNTTTTTMAPPRQPLKILMLHGYTQSGTVFHAKSRALIKHITKNFPLHEVAAIYPTGPISLDPADIPGYEPSSSDQKETEAYGWWRRSNTADPPLYIGIEDGLEAVSKVLRDEGPFDGVIGFSQGAALAAMVAALLEPRRKEAFAHFMDPKVASAGTSGAEMVGGLPYPASFEESVLSHPPLKFALCYSGFRAPGARYRGFYEEPAIQTPILHVLGSLDAVVDESRSRALVEACAGDPEKEGKIIFHPGGHFLPSQRPFLDAAVGFIQGLEKTEGKGEQKEEDVNDMDVPF